MDRNTMIYAELEDVNQVIFFTQGVFLVGFTINRVSRWAEKYDNNGLKTTIIGGFAVTFDKKGQYMYKT